ncbi:uncharacterized protein J7T54_008328 [Emericellopsis cladophorae]|uniref:Uncharacterized protein n=1 Tax=Emericellopsis cladophorae TaxID=2686198 RepID=A0A9Q0BEA5_9HYPO|nr:uncharacterized protein J7T54_008328 [Emericellopsis cladophorae]KAI6782242.1 hypothetical protein J7T54_008328 [Emericellopsis cladophorae]
MLSARQGLSEHGHEANRTTKTQSRLPFLLLSTDPSKGSEGVMAAVAAAEPHVKQTDTDLENLQVSAWSADTIDPRMLHMDFSSILFADDDLMLGSSGQGDRSLVELSEKYTFTELKRYATRAADSLDHFLPACQAANMIVSLQCSIGDPNTRKRMACQRQPAVVDAARAAGFVGVAHSLCGGTEWTDFLHREACIRLVTSVFTNDALLTCFFNHPPSMAIAELSGSMPSPNEVWQAKSEAEFYTHSHQLEGLQGQKSFREAINALMSEQAAYAEAGLEKLSLSQLHTTVLGCQHVVFNYRASMLPKSGLATVMRALDRWALLWATALDRIEPHDRKWLGIAKYAPEIAFISRKVLEAILREQEGDLRYLRLIANYDSSAFHELICHFATEAEASV